MIFQKLFQRLEVLTKIAAGISFAVLIVAVLIQVIGRSGWLDSPVWTEELSRFALLYLAAFGVSLSFKSGDLVNVDVVCEALPGRWPWRLRLISAMLTAGICLVLIMPAWLFTSIGAFQSTPALGWRKDFIHGAMVFLFVLLFLFALEQIISMIKGTSDGLPEPTGDDLP